jgi:DNA integrity scanning protein DisA with diadenylate cyclase activity
VSLSDNELLLAELENEDIKHLLPEFCRTEAAMTEIRRLLNPIQHEGRTVPYGFIFAKMKNRVEQLPVRRRLIQRKNLEPEVVRRLADGLRSFVTYVKPERFLGLLCCHDALTDDAQLVEMASYLGGMVGRVDIHTCTSLYLGTGIVTCENRQWLFKPAAQSILGAATQCVPQADKAIFRKLLDFCYYELSPAKIGATIVWLLRKPAPSEMQKMEPQIALKPYELTLVTCNDTTVIKHLLSNTDGPLILDEATNAIGAAAHLKYSKKSERIIDAVEGTRHTSARRFSYDVSIAVVFVVSSDGPVSVFSDGAKIGHLAVLPAADRAARLIRMAPEKRQDVSHSSYRAICSHCRKTSAVEEVVILGWKDREETYCDVCGNQIYSSMCFQLESHILKKL